jgi:tetratricopeptide (TPR) repeat protein
MKLRVLAILGGILMAGTMSAQTLTDVINEFNTGVEKLNNQEYLVSIDHFNQVLAMAETVGAEADEMKGNAQKQIPAVYYRQATIFMKRKQYDNAIPYLEQTVEFATLYDNNEEIKAKASGYLPQLYVREGNVAWKNKDLDQAHAYFDKALGMNPNLYQAHQGKGMVYLDQDQTSDMMEEFALAKAGAEAKGDTKTITSVNGVIDSYYNKIIKEEFDMVDPEDNDYSYVLEACENALAANPENPRAYYFLATVNNKSNEYGAAIDNALKGLEYETEPVYISGLNFELGTAYDETEEYDKACEVLKKVLEEPFLTRAEKKISNIGCG